MAPTFTTNTLPLVFGAEVSFGTITGGPFDYLDAYVDMSGASPNLIPEWRIYATMGGQQSLVCRGSAGGKAGVVAWNEGSTDRSSTQGQPGFGNQQTSPASPARAVGTTYEFRAFLQRPAGFAGPAPNAAATIVGWNESDTVPDQASASVTVNIPQDFSEVQIATLAGFMQNLDVAASITEDVPVLFTLYAVCGNVTAAIAQGTLNLEGASQRLFSPTRLPGATSYVLKARLDSSQIAAAPAVAVQATATMGGHSSPLGPATMLTPGPQITTLRSVTPTTPTSVVWASTGYVDFVADCGADPTGVADCAPAFDRAYALLSALAVAPQVETAARLFIPPGVYALRSDPLINPWIFSVGATTTSIEIVGAGWDSTIIQLFGHDPPHLANAECVRVADLTFQGTKRGAGSDCNQGLTLASIPHVAVIEHVRFFNVLGTTSCAQLEATTAVVRDVNFVCCGTAGNGVLWLFNCETSLVDSCNFEDVGSLNDVASAPLILNGNVAWITVQSNLATARPTTTVQNCLFDENVMQAILFDGTNQRLGPCLVRGCAFNPPVQIPSIACIQASDVDYLRVDGMFNSGFSPSTGATVGLIGVPSAYLSGLELLPGGHATSYFLQADATTGFVRIEQSPNLAMLSKAGANEIPNQMFQGTAAHGGGTFVVNVPIPASQAALLHADVFMSAGSPLTTVGRLVAKAVVENVGGAAAFSIAIATSANPVNSGAAALGPVEPEVADAGFVGAGPPTAIWTVAGTNAVLTVTNPGATDATVAVRIEETLYGLA
jgi:hypothetical protein